MIIIFLINIKLSARFSSRDGEGGKGEREREDDELFKTLVLKVLYLRFLIRWPNNIEKFK